MNAVKKYTWGGWIKVHPLVQGMIGGAVFAVLVYGIGGLIKGGL